MGIGQRVFKSSSRSPKRDTEAGELTVGGRQRKRAENRLNRSATDLGFGRTSKFRNLFHTLGPQKSQNLTNSKNLNNMNFSKVNLNHQNKDLKEIQIVESKKEERNIGGVIRSSYQSWSQIR